MKIVNCMLIFFLTTAVILLGSDSVTYYRIGKMEISGTIEFRCKGGWNYWLKITDDIEFPINLDYNTFGETNSALGRKIVVSADIVEEVWSFNGVLKKQEYDKYHKIRQMPSLPEIYWAQTNAVSRTVFLNNVSINGVLYKGSPLKLSSEDKGVHGD